MLALVFCMRSSWTPLTESISHWLGRMKLVPQTLPKVNLASLTTSTSCSLTHQETNGTVTISPTVSQPQGKRQIQSITWSELKSPLAPFPPLDNGSLRCFTVVVRPKVLAWSSPQTQRPRPKQISPSTTAASFLLLPNPFVTT